ncbi:two-component system regulatory protein YycI [Oceanobacillus senegalensis]|uniref:two-component system regulatory protein YycI n=1 Tax=Oceanobacillus senegalensis TaxID=1936063 RepID=UPI000A3092CE|nr:two-component system regulatory protein YycI [Oceanobacillus senegalensis]
MQWGHIKTLFILSFLILNIYLLVQLIDKQKNGDYGMINSQESSIEERLAVENISIEPDLNMEISDETYILATQKTFTDQEVEQLENKDNQEITIIDNKLIVSQLDQPISLSKDMLEEEVNRRVKSVVTFPEQFTFWEWNEDLNILIFLQQIDGRPVYYNRNGPGVLLAFLNEEDEITHYTQTLLGEAKQQGSGVNSLYQPIQAIEILYNTNELIPNENVTEVDIGYYSRLIEEGEQIFAPTWNIVVNGKRNYFVNAIEGFVFSSIDKSFLSSVIQDTMLKIQSLDDEKEKKLESFIKVLKQKQQLGNRSENE